jgi:chromate transporter
MNASHPSFGEALRFWAKLGLISFGGPAGQIAIMHAELVEKKKWIGERRFLHALNFCMLLPGPEATQLAIYCGWLLHRTWGGIAAGVLFVLPAAVLLWGLSYVYVIYGDVPWIAAIFHGLKPAVAAIVAAAVLRIGRRALRNALMWAIAAMAFVAIFFLRVPFPAIVAGAAAIGFVGARWRALAVVAETAHKPVAKGAENSASAAVIGDADESPSHARPSWRRAWKVVALSLGLWFAPIVAAGLAHGWDGTLVREGIFFSKAAMVTFGGAYAVLPYVAQQAVEKHAWLTAPQMLDGLGLAETTPGPLIMVVQFVGFLGGWNYPGPLSAVTMATLGAAMTTWVTFVPCFLWIFLAAPHVEQLRGNARIASALATVTAAVVGVVLNLAVWFGWQTLWPAGRVDGFAVAVALLAFGVMLRWNVSVVAVVISSGILGLAWGALNQAGG